ncbi:hypothetical protein [Thalassoglobus polymorphus]|uniref:Preprotein translocase subunit SecD n=1 Tax=Thalassoglobus polymorphus TaxID=2527994 RepID=A0A517QNB2_9PLAN|nr:hypothetical protein [Thalassoglobus polymorphus]QDT33067.1 hypothetical protein Mal48_23190 [Thalassoglobus polymorphus]
MRFRTTLVALILIVSASIAAACSVPVFRYALEHWQPDSYVAYVFHKGDLSNDQQAAIESLQPVGLNDVPAVNLAVKVVDLSETPSPMIQGILDKTPAESFPWMVVQSPPKNGPPQTVWEGAFGKKSAAKLINSPIRETINQRLLKEDSVVWVFLESGLKDVDEPAFELLNKELTRLESELKLPEIEDEDLGDLSVDPDALKVSFSAVRVSRDNPEEKILVEMLLGVEPDLRDLEYMTQPMVFPVFGRGRALYAIVGQGIVPEVIEEAAQFLTGACQCTVKAENPGVDLIMNLDWDKHVIPTETLDESLPPLAGFTGFGLSDTEEAMEEAKSNELAAADSTSEGTAAAMTSTETTEKLNDPSSPENKTESHTADASASAGQVSSTSMGTNILIALVLLVIAVAVGSAVLAPRAN